MRICIQVTRSDISALWLNNWDRTLTKWLQRANEANYEAAVEARLNHTQRVHSVLGKSILTDKEITMPEDDLASQVPSRSHLPSCLSIALDLSQHREFVPACGHVLGAISTSQHTNSWSLQPTETIVTSWERLGCMESHSTMHDGGCGRVCAGE